MVLMEKHNRVNIIHYGSLKSNLITCSVLAADFLFMVYGFDVFSTIFIAMNNIFNRIVPLDVYTDSQSLFDILAKVSCTTEKRILTNRCNLRQCYERREITEVFWIFTEHNSADIFTKAKPCNALQKMLRTNTVELIPNAWVELDIPHWLTKNFCKQKTLECRDDK